MLPALARMLKHEGVALHQKLRTLDLGASGLRKTCLYCTFVLSATLAAFGSCCWHVGGLRSSVITNLVLATCLCPL